MNSHENNRVVISPQLLVSHPLGDWLYKLFMHQACVYENKKQYDKSNGVLTGVIRDAFNNGVIDQSLKNAIEKFQVKLNNKQRYIAYYIRKNIHNSYDAMTTSPVESMNSQIKHRIKASSLNNTSRSLMMITEGTDDRIAAIDKTAQRELQLTIINSKLPIKNLFHRKCVFLLHHQFDGRKQQCCVMHSDSSWIVWKFENQPPYFENDEFNLSSLFPMFANVYKVYVTKKGCQSFLKCDCLLYERSGVPCSHILQITDHIEESMIKVQHLKVYHVHYGVPDSDMSEQLMKATSLQIINEDMGVPVSDICLENALHPNESR